MPLLTCPDCQHRVSDKAHACPNCGRPMAATTVEQTAKKYKGWQVIGCILFFVGLIAWLAGSWGFGVPTLVIGTMLYVCSRAGAWWDHG